MTHQTVCQVRSGLRRANGVAPRRQARPLTVIELRRNITAIDRSTVFGARDAAIILLGYASALRTGELAALTVADLEPKPGGLLMHIHRSKTDQEAAGLPAARITGHSLRAGHATAAYTAGVHLDRIAAQTRHKDLAVLLNRLIRPLDALETTPSRDLGL